MRKGLLVLCAFVATSVAACSSLTPHSAIVPREETDERHFAWCAELGLDLGTNCGYDVLEQCRMTLIGIGGHCFPNPDRGVAVPASPARNS